MLFMLSDMSGLKLCVFLVNDVCEKCQNIEVGVCCAMCAVIYL